jgi:hypothetical protein
MSTCTSNSQESFAGLPADQQPMGITPGVFAAPNPKAWQTCPVCQGRGQVDASFYDWPPPGSSRAILHGPTNCRSCGGRGIV